MYQAYMRMWDILYQYQSLFVYVLQRCQNVYYLFTICYLYVCDLKKEEKNEASWCELTSRNDFFYKHNLLLKHDWLLERLIRIEPETCKYLHKILLEFKKESNEKQTQFRKSIETNGITI
jgi:hypothetical protein